jgi:hypothetical protein
MITVGNTKENIIMKIMPGITSRNVPTKIIMPVTIEATNREVSLDIAKLKLS